MERFVKIVNDTVVDVRQCSEYGTGFIFVLHFSKLTCLHFASWDSNKEWTISMEKGEDIMVGS